MDQNPAVAAPRQFNAAKFVFFYLLHLVSLVFTAVAFGTIIFQIINKFIPDIASPYSGYAAESALKFGISALFVFAPIYYVINHFIMKSLVTGEMKKDSAIRRWLTYLILFASFLVFVGWLIAFVNSFLDGELTTKFLLKTITVLAIAAAVFSFYLYDIRRQAVENRNNKVIKIYFISSLAVVTIVFVASFFAIESPMKTRLARLDDKVIGTFSSIDNCVDQYYRENKKLPGSLEEIKATCDYLLEGSLTDEVQGKSFEYKPIDDKNYELCAQFQTSNKEIDKTQAAWAGLPMKQMLHDKGWQCLSRKVNIDPNFK